MGGVGFFFPLPSPASPLESRLCLLQDSVAADAATLLPALQRFLFRRHVAPQPLHQIVEVDRMAVEIRAVDAGEKHLAADLHAAAPPHAGALYHHRIEAD